MKRTLVSALLIGLAWFKLQAQDSRVESVIMALNSNEAADVPYLKEMIDKAEANGVKKTHKLWFAKGQVYYLIGADPKYKSLSPTAGAISLESFMKNLAENKRDNKKIYKEESFNGMLNAVPLVYYLGSDEYNLGSAKADADDKAGAKEYMEKAIAYWQMIIDAQQYDEGGQIAKMNLSKNYMMQISAEAAMKAGMNDKARQLLNELMKDEKYKNPYVYVQMALLDLEDGDTTKALDFVEKGRTRYPEDKNLLALQISILSAQGKIDALIAQFTDALADEPDNSVFLFNRGTLYEAKAKQEMDKIRALEDSIRDSRIEMSEKRTPQAKKPYQDKIAAQTKQIDSVYKIWNSFIDLAQADYKKATEIDAGFFDAIFNLGALYFNRAQPIIEKANSLNERSATYEKDFEALKEQALNMYREALKYFEKAYELKPDDEAVLFSLQQTHAQLGNEKESMKFKELRENK